MQLRHTETSSLHNIAEIPMSEAEREATSILHGAYAQLDIQLMSKPEHATGEIIAALPVIPQHQTTLHRLAYELGQEILRHPNAHTGQLFNIRLSSVDITTTPASVITNGTISRLVALPLGEAHSPRGNVDPLGIRNFVDNLHSTDGDYGLLFVAQPSFIKEAQLTDTELNKKTLNAQQVRRLHALQSRMLAEAQAASMQSFEAQTALLGTITHLRQLGAQIGHYNSARTIAIDTKAPAASLNQISQNIRHESQALASNLKNLATRSNTLPQLGGIIQAGLKELRAINILGEKQPPKVSMTPRLTMVGQQQQQPLSAKNTAQPPARIEGKAPKAIAPATPAAPIVINSAPSTPQAATTPIRQTLAIPVVPSTPTAVVPATPAAPQALTARVTATAAPAASAQTTTARVTAAVSPSQSSTVPAASITKNTAPATPQAATAPIGQAPVLRAASSTPAAPQALTARVAQTPAAPVTPSTPAAVAPAAPVTPQALAAPVAQAPVAPLAPVTLVQIAAAVSPSQPSATPAASIITNIAPSTPQAATAPIGQTLAAPIVPSTPMTVTPVTPVTPQALAAPVAQAPVAPLAPVTPVQIAAAVSPSQPSASIITNNAPSTPQAATAPIGQTLAAPAVPSTPAAVASATPAAPQAPAAPVAQSPIAHVVPHTSQARVTAPTATVAPAQIAVSPSQPSTAPAASVATNTAPATLQAATPSIGQTLAAQVAPSTPAAVARATPATPQAPVAPVAQAPAVETLGSSRTDAAQKPTVSTITTSTKADDPLPTTSDTKAEFKVAALEGCAAKGGDGCGACTACRPVTGNTHSISNRFKPSQG